MCRYRRSQLLYVVPRPAYHQICDVIVDYRESDGKHQLLRDDGNKASARWLDLREISFTIESVAVTPYYLPKPGDHVIVYDRVDDTVDALNAVVVGLEKCKDTWTVDVEYASVVTRGIVEKGVEPCVLRPTGASTRTITPPSYSFPLHTKVVVPQP